jgi:hypothetical protein
MMPGEDDEMLDISAAGFIDHMLDQRPVDDLCSNKTFSAGSVHIKIARPARSNIRHQSMANPVRNPQSNASLQCAGSDN